MKLSQSLSRSNIRAIYSSPLERAIETADAIARPHGLVPFIRQDLGEWRVGAWEGRTFESLNGDPGWRTFNTARSMACPPGGERMVEVQSRMVREGDEIRSRHPDETVAIVSHADPLRSLVSYYLGSSIDMMQRFEISPASVTVIRFGSEHPSLLCLNHTGDLRL
jgi:probable phosphoglycerate mutase